MPNRTLTRTRRAMLSATVLLLVTGTVSVAVNLPYLPDGGGWDAGVPWVSAGCGVAGIAGGTWCLVQYRRAMQGSGLILQKGGYYGFNLIMLGVCVALLLGGLTLSQPTTSTGLPSMLAVNFARGLFTARTPETPPRQDAGRSGSSGG